MEFRYVIFIYFCRVTETFFLNNKEPLDTQLTHQDD